MPDITAPRPVAGDVVLSSWGSQVHDAIESILGAKLAGAWPAASFSFPFGALALIPGAQVTGLAPGVHVAIGSASVDISAAGFGRGQIVLFVDGVSQAGLGFMDILGPIGQRVQCAQAWLFTVSGAGVAELRAQKTANGGTIQAVATCGSLVVI